MGRRERKELSKKVLEDPNYDNLKHLTYKDAPELCQRLRGRIVNAVYENGGHLSSNLGSVEPTVSLLRKFDALKDDIIFDTGHQSYAYKILTGRDISAIRKNGGVAPFLDRKESEFDKVSTGHSSSSLSMAHGLEIAKRNHGDGSYTIVVIGDGAMESGIAYEALNNIGSDQFSRMIIILNDNGMSIQKARGALAKWSTKVRTSVMYGRGAERFYSMFATHKATRWIYRFLKAIKDSLKRTLLGMNIFENLGFSYIGPIDGNNLRKVDEALDRAKWNRHGPIVVHLLTKKGLGYTPAELDDDGSFHGVGPLKPSKDGVGFCESKTFSHVLSEALSKRMEDDKDAFIIDPAMVVGSELGDVFQSFPDRTFDVGIAEEHAISLAGGMSIKGGHPIVVEYSTFLQRGFDELMEDVARQRTSVLCIVEKCGLAGGDGESHHGIYDVAMARTIPNARSVMPYSQRQLEGLIRNYGFDDQGLTFVRVPRGLVPIVDEEFEKDALEGLVFGERKNTKSLYLGIGPRGYELVGRLSKMIDCGMITDMFVSFDMGPLMEYEDIFLYDVYGIETGTCDIIKARLMDMGWRGRLHEYCLREQFHGFGSNDEILKGEMLDLDHVEKDILESI